jgi:hypothetical protein
MWKNRLVMLLLLAAGSLLFPPSAHADYFQYPCNYPFVGTGADVDVIAHGGGQYCDGPTEINGTHYHCMAGSGGIGGGAIALAPIGGLSISGLGGSGIGAQLGDCHYVCPDLFRPPDGMPNPPAAWIKPLTVSPANNVCRDHMTPAGPDGAPVPATVAEPPPPAGRSLPPGRPVPEAPVPPPPGGPPLVTVPEEPSPLTPGSPLQLP